MTTDTTPAGDTTLTISDEDAHMLAAHATHVQGGFSTPEIERARIEKSISEGRWTAEALAEALTRMRAEVVANSLERAGIGTTPTPAAPEPEDEDEPVTPEQVVDVSAVLADIDACIAIRARMKALKATLAEHETQVKDVLGPATVGVVNGEPVVKWPIRNRTNLVKAKVKALLTDEQFAQCETVTTYRALEFTKE